VCGHKEEMKDTEDGKIRNCVSQIVLFTCSLGR